jgi:hypothetical protein
MNWIAALLLAGPMVRGATAMKPLVCRPVDEAKGKSGAELAQAIEQLGAQFSHANYVLAALLPGDPPIACFASRVDPNKLPMGAR